MNDTLVYRHCLCIFLFLLVTSLPCQGQLNEDQFKELESRYGGSLPADYQQFMSGYEGPRDLEAGIAAQSTGPSETNPHYLWTVERIVSTNDSLRAAGLLTKDQLAFGHIGLDQQLLLYQRMDGQWSSRVFLWNEQQDWYFYLYSIRYTHPYYLAGDLITAIDSVGWENQDLAEVADCLDCLYLYAISLEDADYEDFFLKERKEKALGIYHRLVTQAHPGAAAAMATHFEFQDETATDSVIYWRENAIRWGKVEDNYALADFILDYRPDLTARAVESLKALLSHRGFAGRSALKLSRLYMQEKGEYQNFAQGIQFAKQSSESGNLNAKADLSFYYFKGIGVEKDLQKALNLLEEANTLAKQRFGGGMWEEEIELIKREMKK